ncbi:MAG TPA: DNA polymerase III subunit beta [bacterium]
MHFTVSKGVFQKGLQKVVGVIPTKTTIPILENVLLELKENKLQITGTDLEICISTEVSVNGELDGACAVPAKSLNEILRELPEVPIDIQLEDENKISIRTKNGLYKLGSQPKEEFPSIVLEESEGYIEIEREVLSRMINKTIFAVSTDELRTTLMGVYFQLLPDEFRCVATDGHRLAKINNKSLKSPDFQKNVIVPTKALSLILRNLESTDEIKQVKISFGENHVIFRFSETFIYSKIIEGQYPKYENVIPMDNDKKMTVNKEELTAAVKRVAIFSNSFTHQIKFDIKSDVLKISSEDIEYGGEGTEEIAVKYDLDELEIGYNGLYVLELIRNIDTDEVVFTLKDSISAAIVTPITQIENENLMMLIMPIRLNE